MTDTTERGYNGWKNYETWNAALWLDNDQRAHEEWNSRAEELLQEAIEADESDNPKGDAAEKLAEELEADCDARLEEIGGQVITGMFADILNAGLREIDWRDIADHYLADISIYAAGWNMPGYMPDNPPALFLDVNAAREYIADEIERETENTSQDETSPEESAGSLAIEALKKPGGEYGETIGNYHYFVSEV